MDGSIIKDPIMVSKEGVSFFADLLGGELVSHQEIREALLQNIPMILNDQLNGRLGAKFLKEEVKEVIFGMGGSKALGSDGFLGSFF